MMNQEILGEEKNKKKLSENIPTPTTPIYKNYKQSQSYFTMEKSKNINKTSYSSDDNDVEDNDNNSSFNDEDDGKVDNTPYCKLLRYCCSCCLSKSYCKYCFCLYLTRAQYQQIAMMILYSKLYVIVYILMMGITITLVIYDTAHGKLNGDTQPSWFICLDIICIFLIVFDVILQILSYKHGYFRKWWNIFDFVVVTFCVISMPLYFMFQDQTQILNIMLFIRLSAQILRFIVISRHLRNRRKIIVTMADIVDFSNYEDSNIIAQRQGAGGQIDNNKYYQRYQENSNNNNNNIHKKTTHDRDVLAEENFFS